MDFLTVDNYWAKVAKRDSYNEFDGAREDFRNLLRDAVNQELVEGTVGAFLSGGTDSSTIVGVMTECMGAPVKSYSIGFDADGYDEANYARVAAESFGSDHSRVLRDTR